MLSAVEFQAKIQNSLIQIPDEYKQELGASHFFACHCERNEVKQSNRKISN
ncbi:MAG: hypothetical protein V7K49_22540 [Nostoc sp.]